MKQIFSIVLATSLLLVSFSCKKDNNETNLKEEIPTKESLPKTKEPFTINFSYDEYTNTLSGDSFESELTWTRHSNTTDKPDFIAKVYLDLHSIEQIDVIGVEKSTSTLELKADNNNFLITNIASSRNNLSFDIKGVNERLVKFNITGLDADCSNVMSQVYVGQSLTNSKIGVFALAFAAACLFAGAVDLYCDNVIVNGVASCTRAGKCSIVRTCEVECISCSNN